MYECLLLVTKQQSYVYYSGSLYYELLYCSKLMYISNSTFILRPAPSSLPTAASTEGIAEAVGGGVGSHLCAGVPNMAAELPGRCVCV